MGPLLAILWKKTITWRLNLWYQSIQTNNWTLNNWTLNNPTGDLWDKHYPIPIIIEHFIQFYIEFEMNFGIRMKVHLIFNDIFTIVCIMFVLMNRESCYCGSQILWFSHSPTMQLPSTLSALKSRFNIIWIFMSPWKSSLSLNGGVGVYDMAEVIGGFLSAKKHFANEMLIDKLELFHLHNLSLPSRFYY